MNAYRLVKVGVRYCIEHDGIANEDDYDCDFRQEGHATMGRVCDFRELYRKEKRPAPHWVPDTREEQRGEK